jgi:hypothetical protein
MSDTMRRWTRRAFLRGAATATLAGPGLASLATRLFAGDAAPRAIDPASGAGTGGPGTPAAPAAAARVVLVRHADVLAPGRKPRPEILAKMVDDGVAALLQEKDPAAAWARLVRPDDTVGIKSNSWRFLPTPPELEAILRDRVAAAGVPAARIAVDDRGVLENPVFLKATALLNARPMRTHHWAGVGSCIKNYIMFSPDPPSWHPDSCANLAGLWDLPAVKGKTRLNILVMLAPLFHGSGPHDYQARYTWEYNGLILGTDPVAVDATGLRVLEAKRRAYFGNDQPFVVPPKHIRVADEKFHLGVADPARIDLVRLGPADGALVGA